ncbi:penicillin-binding protein 2 [Patescibacteria group bacterium]|nr:penicillin-binding protein 2 [Patescibacteria group bacterium]
MKIRIFCISALFIFSYLFLVSNIYKLQVSKGIYYSARAESQTRLSGFLQALRGNIYFTDRNENSFPAAINKEYYVIFAVPTEIINPDIVAEQIANLFDLNKEGLITSFSKPNDLYEVILKKASKEQANIIKELDIDGIYIDKENFRFYPLENIASHLLGYISPNSENNKLSGRYGIETYFNTELTGEDGYTKDGKVINPEDGGDIILTIDPIIQNRAETMLIDLINKHDAKSGSVIVQDPKSGKIIALGNYPNFDPNNYSKFEIKNFLNPVVENIYEPGSVFKIITMSAGLDSNKFTPDTTYIDKGFIKLNGRTIKNWDIDRYGPHGEVTMTEIIENSLNTGASYAGQLIGKDLFYNYLVKFGFDQKTGIELPGEVAGDIRKLKTSVKDVDFATASFGQGIAVSPIAMINSFSAIANGGNLMRPYIVSGNGPEIIRQVISKKAATEVIDMMVSAVEKAYVARIQNYKVAGKTGTAQVPDFKNGGYSDEYIHTFIGFAPAYNPEFTILIKLDKPAGSPLAGTTVVPAFRDLAEFLLNYYNVLPDNIE